jgi:hypothetical protein
MNIENTPGQTPDAIKRKELHYAAIRYNGALYKGFGHAELLQTLAAEFGQEAIDAADEDTLVYGYATDDDRFIDKETAREKYAINSSEDL